MMTTVSVKDRWMLHRYVGHTMETQTGIQCIQTYTASALEYAVYKMYTRTKEKGVII